MFVLTEINQLAAMAMCS